MTGLGVLVLFGANRTRRKEAGIVKSEISSDHLDKFSRFEMIFNIKAHTCCLLTFSTVSELESPSRVMMLVRILETSSHIAKSLDCLRSTISPDIVNVLAKSLNSLVKIGFLLNEIHPKFQICLAVKSDVLSAGWVPTRNISNRVIQIFCENIFYSLKYKKCMERHERFLLNKIKFLKLLISFSFLNSISKNHYVFATLCPTGYYD
jgi:hypothetical protein